MFAIMIARVMGHMADEDINYYEGHMYQHHRRNAGNADIVA